MHPSKTKQSEGERMGRMAALGGAGSALEAFMLRRPNVLGRAALGAGMGAGAQGIGDMIMGHPEKHSFGEEAKRGAVGGALVGGLAAPLLAGSEKGGGALLHHLIREGYSKNKAMAILMGGTALAGAASGAFGKGLDSGFMNSDYLEGEEHHRR